MIWPVTQLNTLRFDLGIGYSFYLDHSDANTDSVLIAPKSQLAFDIFVGDFRINLHDRFQLQQDPIQVGALSNVSDYGRFENTAGLSVLWDLNKVLLQVGYDHYNYIATNDDFDYINHSSEIVYGSGAFIVNPTITVGASVQNAVNTFKWDTTALRTKHVRMFFDGKQPQNSVWDSSYVTAPAALDSPGTLTLHASTWSERYIPAEPRERRASGDTAAISVMSSAAPPNARAPKWARWKSFGAPSSAL